jgi:hypothetical protein
VDHAQFLRQDGIKARIKQLKQVKNRFGKLRMVTMSTLTMKMLKQLTQIEDECCMSLYMPTRSAASTNDAQRIRLKNLLKQAEKSARQFAAKNKKLFEKIGEGERILANDFFWRHQGNGLVMFISPDHFSYFRLPLSFDESFSISRRFYIKPLIPLFMADGSFFILALSQGGVRLFSCTRHDVMAVELEDVPASIEDVVDYDKKRSQLQMHVGAAAGTSMGGSGKAGIFHGHGVGIDDAKDEIFRYFREVDNGLRQIMGNEHSPLVLAGVEYLLPIFRKASTYPYIIDEAIMGNPERLKPEELHAQALEIVVPELQKQQHAMERRYHESAGKGYTAAGVRTVLPAAARGQVEALFVALDESRPGRFDRQNNEVMVLDEDDDPAVEDLLDLAAVETLRHDGKVYALERDKLPDTNAAVAAVLRY